MAARDQELVSCPAGAWTLLTDNDVTTFSLNPYGDIVIRGTTDITTPTDRHGFIVRAGEGFVQKAVADIFSAAGIDRVWGRPRGNDDVDVVVDHA